MNHAATLEALLIHRHVPALELQAKCSTPLRALQRHQHGWVFNSPVDPVELGLPDYFDIITKPMDLGTVQTKLEAGKYKCIEDFASDVNLVFDNAMTYNEPGSVVHPMALEIKQQFHADYASLRAQMVQEYGRRQDVARLVLKQRPVVMVVTPVKRKRGSRRCGGSGVVA